MPMAKDVSLDRLAEMTEGYSGADIEGLVREAAMAAVRSDWKPKPVTMADFSSAMKEIRPSISDEDAKRFLSMADRVLKRQPGKKEEEALSHYV